ncbi:MAG: helix-turn-helix domain-containing protein, partial [Singulisphaera sp.]
MADRRLKPLDVLLVAVLLRYARSKSVCWASVPTLAGDVGRCVRMVQYSLKRLQMAGWLRFEADSNPTGRV